MSEKLIPEKLRNDPITSAIFEIRFAPSNNSLADLLPGMLYSSIASDFPFLRNLPFSEVPPQVKSTIPDWTFHATKQMSSQNGCLNINFAHSAVTIENVRPYVGWATFKPVLLKMIENIKTFRLVDDVVRYSFRYQNLFSNKVIADLSDLSTTLSLGSHLLRLGSVNIRSEIDYKDAVAIVQVLSNVGVVIQTNERRATLEGTMLDIDVLMNGPHRDFFETFDSRIEQLHAYEKELFFSLLSESALQRLERGD